MTRSVPATAQEFGAHPARSGCRVCGGTMSVHDAARSGTCAKPFCRAKALRDDIARRRQEEVERLRREASAWRDGAGLDENPVVLLPANEGRLAPLPERRRRAFLATVAELTRAALAHQGSDEAPERPSHPTEAEKARLAAGCAICRGFCCTRGGEHAFLRVDTLRHYLETHDTRDVGAVVRAYARHLPATSHRDSCVYHASQGCTLPRAMRSSICNDFYCRSLEELLAQIRAAPAADVFGVATSGGILRRAAVIDTDGGRRTVRRPPRAGRAPRGRRR